jgi:hypothetical protein
MYCFNFALHIYKKNYYYLVKNRYIKWVTPRRLAWLSRARACGVTHPATSAAAPRAPWRRGTLVVLESRHAVWHDQKGYFLEF